MSYFIYILIITFYLDKVVAPKATTVRLSWHFAREEKLKKRREFTKSSQKKMNSFFKNAVYISER